MEAILAYLFGMLTALETFCLIASIEVGDIGHSVWFAILSTVTIVFSILIIRVGAKAHKRTRLIIKIKDDAE